VPIGSQNITAACPQKVETRLQTEIFKGIPFKGRIDVGTAVRQAVKGIEAKAEEIFLDVPINVTHDVLLGSVS
jgi:hypothetical protein